MQYSNDFINDSSIFSHRWHYKIYIMNVQALILTPQSPLPLYIQTTTNINIFIYILLIRTYIYIYYYILLYIFFLFFPYKKFCTTWFVIYVLAAISQRGDFMLLVRSFMRLRAMKEKKCKPTWAHERSCRNYKLDMPLRLRAID